MAKKFGVNRRWVQEWCQQMDKLQKLKKSFICRFGWKDFPSYYKYIHSRAIFVLKKGGRASIGYRASIGTYTVNLSSIHAKYTTLTAPPYTLPPQPHPNLPQGFRVEGGQNLLLTLPQLIQIYIILIK